MSNRVYNFTYRNKNRYDLLTIGSIWKLRKISSNAFHPKTITEMFSFIRQDTSMHFISQLFCYFMYGHTCAPIKIEITRLPYHPPPSRVRK